MTDVRFVQMVKAAVRDWLQWVSTAPWNNKLLSEGTQKFSGVGGHLFAVAAEESFKKGFSGYMMGIAANERVLRHYVDELGATYIGMIHQYQIIFMPDASAALIKKYSHK